MSDEEYKDVVEYVRKTSREAIQKVFTHYDLNILIGPTESAMDTYAAAAGEKIHVL
jgi:hypothetical protein